MMRLSIAAALALVTALAALPAQACAVHQPLDIRSALGADLVVVGRVRNHNIDPNGNEWFDVAVTEVLRGGALRSVTVRHSSRMLGPLSSLPRRPVLIALRREGGAHAVSGTSARTTSCSTRGAGQRWRRGGCWRGGAAAAESPGNRIVAGRALVKHRHLHDRLENADIPEARPQNTRILTAMGVVD